MSRLMVDSPKALGLATSAGSRDMGLRTAGPSPKARGSTATLRPQSASTSTVEGRKQTLGAIGRAGAASGFEAACLAAQRVVEGGRVPDDATVDVLSGRIAAGSGGGGADLSVYDGFLKGAVGDGR